MTYFLDFSVHSTKTMKHYVHFQEHFLRNNYCWLKHLDGAGVDYAFGADGGLDAVVKN